VVKQENRAVLYKARGFIRSVQKNKLPDIDALDRTACKIAVMDTVLRTPGFSLAWLQLCLASFHLAC
jgi:hypothetical protein